MKKIFIYALCLLVLAPLAYFSTYTVIEYAYESKNYRAHNSSTNFKRILSKHCTKCLTDRYKSSETYPFSGGGRINFHQMERMNQSHSGPVYVVNLRDNNGMYYNYKPVSYWGLLPKNDTFVYNHKRNKYKQVLYKLRRLWAGLPGEASNLNPSNFLNEKETLEKMGIHYVKYELFRKNFSTHWGFVDNLIALFESMPADAWVHFHCAGGRGRTTTVAIIYDIFRNGTQASLQDITDHHFCLGGEDMMDTALIPKGTWTKEKLEGRKALIQSFYNYMSAHDGYPTTPWSQWLKRHAIPLDFKYGEWVAAGQEVS